MGANEELTNLLNESLNDDFWTPMEVEGSFTTDTQWLSGPRETRPLFFAKKPQQGAYAACPWTLSSSSSDLYAFSDNNLVDRPDSYGQNFLSETVLEAVPERSSLSEAMLRMDSGLLKSISQFPHQQTYAYDVDLFDGRPMSGRESESTNSSLETTFKLTDSFLAHEGAGRLHGISSQSHVSLPLMTSSVISLLKKPLELPMSLFTGSLKDVKVEHGGFQPTTMMVCPSNTLPELKPPILPKLCTGGLNPLLVHSPLEGGAWNMYPHGRVLGRSLTESKREESPSMRKVASVPANSCVSRSTQSCDLLCNSNFSMINKCPKKPCVGKLTPEERQLKILRYRQKRSMRKFDRGVTYQCRKTLADRRPRVRGRFARNNDIHATFPKNKEPPQDSTETSQQTSEDSVRGL